MAETARPALAPTIERAAAAWSGFWRLAERGGGAWLDLFIRLAIAQPFFVSGVLKLADWNNALFLAEFEYPVSWLAPGTAAALGVATELGGALLLALGLATRAAALALFTLALVIQFAYRAFDVQLFWAALLLWIALRGAGAFSLDRLLARGLAESALPGAAVAARALAALTRLTEPPRKLLLRAWLAAALFAAGAGAQAPLMPVDSAAAFATPATLFVAALLAAGAATRAAALALLAAVGGAGMAGGGEATLHWLAALSLVALHGGGAWAVDALTAALLRRRFPRRADGLAFDPASAPRVVIVGAGFGGLACAAKLMRAQVSVTLVDRHNYHLFQPLLYQVATASLSPGDIATPVRGMFREHANVRVLLAEVTGVDTARREVLLGAQRLPYDHLVLATGAAHSYFGRDEWSAFAPGLKRVEDATEVRRRLLGAFERAEACEDDAERSALLTFLVVGGGPTGVELAGAIAELARLGMEKDFRRFDPASARVVLVQAGGRILPAFPEPLSARSRESLERLGVEVLTDSRVEAIDADGVVVNGRRIAARTVLWAAGVVASPAARWLGAQADAAGRVKVAPDLSVPGCTDVYALGDTALSTAWRGQPVPGLAPAARQGGEYVARVIRARIEGRRAPPPFAYRHLGSLATIGRKAAVADFGALRLEGALAWWLWGAVHVAFLVDLRGRISVMLDWIWSYLTYRSGTRLITGAPAPEAASAVQPAGAVDAPRAVRYGS